LEFLLEYGMFFAKTLTFVVAIAVIVTLVLSAGMKQPGQELGQIEIIKINDKYDEVSDIVRDAVLDEDALKLEEKHEKQRFKEEKKQRKANLKKQKAADKKLKKEAKNAVAKDTAVKSDASKDGASEETTGDKSDEKKRVYVLDFDGDIKASETDLLRETITAVLTHARPTDEVVLRLESQGGMVHAYGLAASQLTRLTKAKIPLTICVDKVAASGGYMMACVAQKIIAAPFAVIGSIGVVAQLPNFHRVLKKYDVDYETFTAGEYKRTVTMFGENTEKGKQKFSEELEDTHVLFKGFIAENRPQVDIASVATGEVWYGLRAVDNKLIDEVATSDDYIFGLREEADLFEVSYTHKRTLAEKFGINMEAAIERSITKGIDKLFNNKLFN